MAGIAGCRILIINPNTTKSMTVALKPLVESLGYSGTEYVYFTAPEGPKSINNDKDAIASADSCYKHIALFCHEGRFDGYLVACYSHHPLVGYLRNETNVPVIGIFEASILVAQLMLHPDYARKEQFGIVSTGKIWETLLGEATLQMLGSKKGALEENGRFAGVETTGLNATELHSTPPEEVKKRIKEAAGRLVKRGNVTVVLLGCAGMAGMDQWIKEEVGRRVKVVDGVKCGVGALQALIRGDH